MRGMIVPHRRASTHLDDCIPRGGPVRSTLALGAIVLLSVVSACSSSAGDKPPFDAALLVDDGVGVPILLWDIVTDDCQHRGKQGQLPSGTLVGVTLVRNDCEPKMYFVGTGWQGENGWVSEYFLQPK